MLLKISHIFLLVIITKISHQIQIRTEVQGVNLTSRQNFQIQQFHIQFQYRPDFGGPWQNVQWNRPSYSQTPTSSKRPFAGVGSASPVYFKGPSSNNYNKNSSGGGSYDIYSSTPQTSKNNNRDKNPNSGVKITNTCKCGAVPKTARSLERITGGTLSKDNAWPFMASIVYVGSDAPFWFCGASLINDRYLITAAHCQKTIKRRGLSNIRILLGTNGIPSTAKDANFYEISDLKTHPSYKQNIEEYDIGLIKLKNKITFSESISPICLTQQGSPYTDKLATVAGWGSIKYGDNPPENLREVEIKVVTNALCQREYMYNYGTRITSAMLCAWLPGKDSCQGDSGSALFLKDTISQAYTQIGVVSFGPPQCGETSIPGVYTRIASTIRWLQANTHDSTYCQGSF